MNIISILLLSTITSHASLPHEPIPNGAPTYFEKWTMVGMWPQPQVKLTEEQVAEVKRDKYTAAYTLACFKPDGSLWTIEEIVNGKRKLKFEYIYDNAAQVIRIDLFMADGQTKTYYKRHGKAPEKKEKKGAMLSR